MEFDKARVYTAVNADELKVGSKIIVADNLSDLKRYVEREENYCTLASICDEEYTCRFELSSGSRYSLAYLVSEPEEKVLKWTDLKIGDVVRCKTSKVEHLVTGIHYGDRFVFFGDEWTDDKGLENWEKVEDTDD